MSVSKRLSSPRLLPRRPIGIVLCIALLNSCVGLHGYDSVADLREDALNVFREHNQTASEVMLELPGLDPADPATGALADADASMLAACEPLNELAIAHRDGQDPSLRQRARLPAAIDACRQATHQTRQLLDET